MTVTKRTVIPMLKAMLFCGILLFSGQALAQSTSTVTTDLVRLTKSAPSKVAVGETFTVTYTVEARQDVANVVVSDSVPSGAQLAGSEPQAQTQGNGLSWTIDHMAPGESRTMTLSLTPQGVGTLESCATVSAQPHACVATVVGRPELAITKDGPAQAMLGDQVRYQIMVSNTGSSEAHNVVVTDRVPEGMSHSSGQRDVTTEVGTLAPGQSRSLSILLTADQRGEFCNVASATSDNTEAVEAQACTRVVDQQIEITKTGTERQFIGKQATYNIAVNNPGDLDLTNVTLTDQAPAGTSIVSAEGATINGNTATWNIGTLAAGATETRQLVLTSRDIGSRTNCATVRTAEGLSAEDCAPTLWQGYPALLIEVVDTVDPLQPGEVTTYVITITNQGSAEDRNIKITANFPAEIKPLSASGDTQATIDGQTVDMALYEVLEPQQEISWTIRAEAVKAGDARTKFNLTSRLLQTPVTEEESTQVY